MNTTISKPRQVRSPGPVRTLGSLRAAAALAASLAVPTIPLAAQESGIPVLDDAARRFEGITVLCARFEQVLTVTLLDQTRESAGELCQRSPNFFSMRFSDPAGDAVVADGEFFWIYYASVNPDQVLKLPLDPTRGGLDFYREFLDRPGEKYDASLQGRETIDGSEVLRVDLRPRQSRGYRSAKVWIAPAESMIRRVEIVEDNGTVRRITLHDLRIDPPVGPEAFRFDPPPGVVVISR